MFIITFNAGIGYDKSGHALSSSHVVAACNVIRKHIAQTAGGYTETDTHGGWVHNGELVQENGKQWTVAYAEDRKEVADAWAENTAQYIAGALNQGAVMASVHSATVEFITQ